MSDLSDTCMEPFFPLLRNVVHTHVVLLGFQSCTDQDMSSLSDPVLV